MTEPTPAPDPTPRDATAALPAFVRRHASPFAEKTPLKPMYFEISTRRCPRLKPSGRSRSTAAMVSGFASARKRRAPMRNEKNSPYSRLHFSAVRCSVAESISSRLPRIGSPRGPGSSLIFLNGTAKILQWFR